MTRIGLVEDTLVLRELLTDVLEERGYEVQACGTVGGAREAFSWNPPDLLITDVRLPDGDGLDFLGELRRLHAEGDLPVLVLSGLGGEDDLLRGFEAGATDYITKPLKTAELLAKCSVLLSRAHKSQPASPVNGALPGGKEVAFGRYRIDAILGQGNVGLVYRAFDLKQDLPVALKVLTPISCMHEETRQRFIREAYSLSQVRHPSIVPVYDFGSAEGRLFCAMELVEGETLEDKIGREGPASEPEARALLRALLDCLAALEAVDLLHRDIKPENIILRGGDYADPVVVDFGLAKTRLDRSLTVSGELVGTPAYMSPELALGHDPDGRADQFSAALVVRFACTGSDIFPELGYLELLQALTTRQVDVPSELSPPLQAILRRMLSITPGDRFPSASEALAALGSE